MKKVVFYLFLFAGISSSVFTQNNALDFDGANDFIDLPNNANLNFPANTSATIEAWVNTTFTGPSIQMVFSNQNCGLGETIMLWMNDNGTVTGRVKGTSCICPANVQFSSTATINDGTWHHIALVHDLGSNLASIYIDGVLDGQVTDNETGTLTSSAPFNRIGNRAQCGQINYFDGQIDEVRVWKVARSANEINANLCTSLVGNETGLAAYYNFDQGTAGGNNAGVNSLIDQVGGSNGSLNGFALNGATSNWVSSQAFNSIACQAPPPVPTLSQWALIILGLLITSFGAIAIFNGRKLPSKLHP